MSRITLLLLCIVCFAFSGRAQEVEPAATSSERDTSVILRTYIAGLKHHISRKEYDALQLGETLLLKAEPENKYDKHAIAIYKGDDKIGFIPAQEAEALGEALSLSSLIAIINKKGMDGSESAMSVSISVRRE